jgi:hypothetical protein
VRNRRHFRGLGIIIRLLLPGMIHL